MKITAVSFAMTLAIAMAILPNAASAYVNHNGSSSADTMIIGVATVGGVVKVVDCKTTGGVSTLVIIDATHDRLQSALNIYGQGGNDTIFVVSGTESGTVTGCGYTISKVPYNGFGVMLDGGNGNDTLVAGEGNDLVYGDSNGNCGFGDSGAGNDNLYLRLGTDDADGCDGDDTILAGLAAFNTHASLSGDTGVDCLGTYGWSSPGSVTITTPVWDCEGGNGGASGAGTSDQYTYGVVADPYCFANIGICSNHCGTQVSSCPVR
jgi:Ca2+-binding RTX toxin-like protein